MPDYERDVTTRQLAELLRVTYRQLDHWLGAGFLPAAASTPGIGNARRFTPDEVELARVFAALVHAGVAPHAVGEALMSVAIGPHRFVVELGELIVTGEL